MTRSFLAALGTATGRHTRVRRMTSLALTATQSNEEEHTIDTDLVPG